MEQDLEQGKGVLAAGDPEQDAVSIADHGVIDNRPSHPAQQGFGRFDIREPFRGGDLGG